MQKLSMWFDEDREGAIDPDKVKVIDVLRERILIKSKVGLSGGVFVQSAPKKLDKDKGNTHCIARHLAIKRRNLIAVKVSNHGCSS